MIALKDILSHVWPKRLAPRAPLTPAKRLELLGTVNEHDPCLQAVTDQLMQMLAGEFVVVIDPQRSDAERLRACEGLRVSYWTLQTLENERDQAKAQRAEQENQTRR